MEDNGGQWLRGRDEKRRCGFVIPRARIGGAEQRKVKGVKEAASLGVSIDFGVQNGWLHISLGIRILDEKQSSEAILQQTPLMEAALTYMGGGRQQRIFGRYKYKFLVIKYRLMSG